jgi:hypothetical protein
MSYVLRQIHPPGKSARADEATTMALVQTLSEGGPQLGDYLEWSDPNARHGFGDDRWTDDVTKAQRFPSFEAAMACWTTQSTKRPFRDDGKPNRPLTAYSVTVEKVET